MLCAAALAVHDGRSVTLLWWLVGAPLSEELVFRRGLQDGLVRHWSTHSATGTVLAIVVASMAFALAHAIVLSDARALLTVLPSLAIGAAYARRGRLRDAVSIHAACNAVWLAWGSSLLPWLAT